MTNSLRDEWGPFSPEWNVLAIVAICPEQNLRLAVQHLVSHVFDQESGMIECEEVIQLLAQLIVTGRYYTEYDPEDLVKSFQDFLDDIPTTEEDE